MSRHLTIDQIRSEEHTSELQSRPTRRSSDLNAGDGNIPGRSPSN